MKTAVVCFTSHGEQTACRIAQGEENCQVWIKKKEPEKRGEALTESPLPEGKCDARASVIPLTGSLKEWTGQRFRDSDALIFVGAAGIAVRSIAPFLKSKKTDPAVLVADELGTFVISLISGHIGGANELAQKVAEKIAAIPVITTATDRNGLWAVDVFARKNGLAISDMTLAKYISAALLDGQNVLFGSEFPIEGKRPPELTQITAEECYEEASKGKMPLTVWVGIHTAQYLFRENGHNEPGRQPDSTEDCEKSTAAPDTQKNLLLLVPPVVTLGIGCRKGKEPEKLIRFAADFLRRNHINASAVEQICSIDIKKEEAGILAVAEKMKVPFETFSAEKLRNCQGEFTPSAFVAQTVGVDNVCERSALLGAAFMEGRAGKGSPHGAAGQKPQLILHKNAQDGMTIAAAVRPWQGTF